jgi:RNA polymerase primary sigma factor/RNA polymerase sigma factor
MAEYQHTKFQELEKQLLLSPPPFRRRHADRLEQLITSLDPETDYSYEFIYFRATGFRPAGASLQSYRGSELHTDLLHLLHRISQSAPTEAAEVPEPVLSIEQVAAACNVAQRTVFRWHRKGLVSRAYVFPDGRRRTGVRKSALDQFSAANKALVERSGRFSRLSEAEREEILRQARTLDVQGGPSRTAAAAQIAGRVGRAKETIRLALSHARGEHPHQPLFHSPPGRLSEDRRMGIYRAYKSGQPLATLCERFRRSRPSIHRIVNEARARLLLADASAPGRFIADEAFTREEADKKMLPAGAAGSDAGSYAGNLPATGPLSPAQERELFRRYNYLKYKAAQLKAKLNPKRYVAARLLDETEALLAAARTVKQRLEEINRPLVEDVARKHAGRLVGLRDLVAEGRVTLRQAIDAFDYRRSDRFASYLRWALMSAFARTLPEEHY